MKATLSTGQFMVLVGVVAASGVVGGALSNRVFSARDARAQESSSSATLSVPPEGIVFKSAAGKTVARVVSSDAGGSLELYDAREQIAARIGASPQGGALDLATPRGGAAARLVTTGNGSGLELLNARGQLGVRLGADTNGGNVNVYDESGMGARVLPHRITLDERDPWTDPR